MNHIEQILISAISAKRINLAVNTIPVKHGVDPVIIAHRYAHEAVVVHSTSWRFERGNTILTFVYLYPDGTDLPAVSRIRTVGGIENSQASCHAIRHLWFLKHTDPDVDVVTTPLFWEFARGVAQAHHPAVAGLLNHL